MNRIVVLLEIGIGTFAEGFPVTLWLYKDSLPIKQQRDCPRIPANPVLPALYTTWQQLYGQLGRFRSIQPVLGQITNESLIDDCQAATKKLEQHIRQWFQQDLFASLRDRVLAQLGMQREASTSVVLDIHTGDENQNLLLRKLPWHLWDLFNELPNADVVLSAGFNCPTPPLKLPINILAILGSREGELELSQDAAVLQELQQIGAHLTRLEQPTRAALHTALCDHTWDILFFAGHSSSGERCQTGYIQIAEGTLLSLGDLREDLRVVVKNGLKLAIFNSCDGLGLVNYLQELQVPSMVVMREPVPDVVAREFLRHFLKEFSRGMPLCPAVRAARNQLHWRESAETPCPAASWLPIVCQNPTQPELLWPASHTLPIPVQASAASPASSPRRSPLWLLGSGLIVLAMLVAVVTINRRPSPPAAAANYLSLGEKQLLRDVTSTAKREGIMSVAAGRYTDAIAHFRAALHDTPNDPETWIYLNNAIAAQNAATRTSQGTLPIAVSVPVGLNPKIAEELLRGVAIAQSQTNCQVAVLATAIQNLQSDLSCQGGINGKLLSIQIADDNGDDNSVIPIATALVESDMLAIIGHYSSGVTQKAVEEVYTKAGPVIISPSSTSVRLSGLSHYLFRTSTNDAIAAQMLARYALHQRLNRIAVAYVPGDPYSESLRDEFRKSLMSQKFVYECNLLEGGASFNAESCLQGAMLQGAQALLLVPSATKVSQALQLVNSNNGKLRLLGGDTMYDSRTVTDFGQEAFNSHLIVAIPWQRNNSSFEKQAQQLFGNVGINWRTAMTYDAAQAIIAGLAENPTREGLRQALSRSDFQADGATGPGAVRFDQSGDRLPGNSIGVLVTVAQTTNGTYQFQAER
jgi:branched-chain amino acid transport system substrate-binding protein